MDTTTDSLPHDAGATYQDLKNDIKDPLPEDRGEGAKTRVPREKLEAHWFTAFRLDFKDVILVVGQFHLPIPVEVVDNASSSHIRNCNTIHTTYPESGTPAAWAQRKFYPEAIPANNWFAKLQRSAMKPNGE
ncbi:hypothetical protein D9756_009790 [Leucocoprinus leucothites]|uniref:Uncharacterized protein n=1 Tax=Leucocoprinus leucothites TaxID=201217 RepID=A0A8H5CVY5_9AGAR|nr:hypothetical protein D9756_009790 [Leucoagaricus leucothites]